MATEVRFAGNLKVDTIRAAYQHEICGDFPNLLVPGAQEGVAPALQHYRFEKADGTCGIQLAVNSFSYYSRAYAGHDSFLKETKAALSAFVRRLGKPAVKRIGWRYINAIPFAREKDLVPLHRFFRHLAGIEITAAVRLSAVDFQATLPAKRREIRLKLQSAKSRSAPEEESLVLDIDAFKTLEARAMGSDQIFTEIKRIHALAYECFEDMITDSYRAHLRGEKDA